MVLLASATSSESSRSAKASGSLNEDMASRDRTSSSLNLISHANGFIGLYYQVPRTNIVLDSATTKCYIMKIKKRYRGVDYSFDLIASPLLPKFSTSYSESIIILKVPHRNDTNLLDSFLR